MYAEPVAVLVGGILRCVLLPSLLTCDTSMAVALLGSGLVITRGYRPVNF